MRHPAPPPPVSPLPGSRPPARASVALLAAAACLIAASLGACRGDAPDTDPRMDPSATSVSASGARLDQSAYINPADAFGELFVAVQMSDLFEDSKTFVDMAPRRPVDEILADYERYKDTAPFDLAAFVEGNFEPAKMYAKDFESDAGLDLDKHIERLWPVLTRDEELQGGGSLIPLPNDYVVPGGRFREVYYWDSYFTMLGLLVDGQDDYARRMVDNFAFLIDEVGHIPNGNRSYYLSRSQPPFFAPMVGLLAEAQGDSVVERYLPQLEREYAWWMRGRERLAEPGDEALRVARLDDGLLVNRYFDERPRPRPEGFREDTLLAAEHPERAAADLYLDLRAAAESGWDFGSRWLSDPADLGTIRTTRIAPVDLNSLLYYLENMLSEAYARRGDDLNRQRYAERAYERRRAVLSAFFDDELRWFTDYDLDAHRSTGEATLAGLFPLFFGLATEQQAAAVAERVREDFLKPGGVVTSLRTTGQQWDAPNGWAPLQWVTIAGLRRYGHTELAEEVARRWLNNGRRVYGRVHKVVEKYNVVDTTTLAGGGEYPNQDGFGWSNGVFARIIEDYPGL